MMGSYYEADDELKLFLEMILNYLDSGCLLYSIYTSYIFKAKIYFTDKKGKLNFNRVLTFLLINKMTKENFLE